MAPRLFLIAALIFVLGASGVPARAGENIQAAHAVAMSGAPKYPAGFAHFDYADPNAPKGGKIKLSAIGTYDSFNPFLTKGDPATGVGLVYDSLTVQSDDEPFTQYGLLAEKIEWPADRSWVIFHLDSRARFHDGVPVAAADVEFSFKTLMNQGNPLYRHYWAGVKKVEVLDDRRIKFHLGKESNPELLLILGQLTVLPKHALEKVDFTTTGLAIPLGSGPYKISEFKPGHAVAYARVDDYWAKDHPVNKGRFNFDSITYDYYRDGTVALQAFKSGEYDYRLENVAKEWATAYTGPRFDQGLIKKEEIHHENPAGMQGFVMNIRRPLFQDRRVREALALVFDFEWTNKTLFYGQYTRTTSYFANSELASSGLPSPAELNILEPFRDNIPPEAFDREYRPPTTDGSGDIRNNLRQALKLLGDAGWAVKDGVLANQKDGRPFKFEIMLQDPAFERIVLPFTRNLGRLGIKAEIRFVDSSQYLNRVNEFDFDMIVHVLAQSNSPGNEQRDFWFSTSADVKGSQNVIGLKNEAVDRLVELIIAAPDRRALIDRTRALDRVLLWGFYVIPHWHLNYYRAAYWDIFSHPAVTPKYDAGFFSWWVDPVKWAKVEQYRTQTRK
ncbi:MAG: extracellular solute-binding protein [Pseudomonadota bacterium]